MQPITINANSLDEIAQDNTITVIAVVGKSGCGKTHLADALVKRLRDVRAPCFPVFIDEAHPDTKTVITAAVQVATPDRPVVVAGQLYGDVSRYIADRVTQGTAIVLSGSLGENDVGTLSALFGVELQVLAAIRNREFLALRRKKI